MKTYTTIPNNIVKLNFADIYRFTCLSFTPRKDGYTDSTFKQIKDITKDVSEETVGNFVQRLRESELIEIKTIKSTSITNTIVNRNHYYIPEYSDNFRMINNSFLELNISIELKGFLIGLYTLCLNNTKVCGLKQKEIANKLGVNSSTVSRYIKQATSLNLIAKVDSGFQINIDSFICSKFTKEIKQRIVTLLKVDSFKTIIINTNWDSVQYPKEYLDKMEMGLFNIKIDSKNTSPKEILI